VETWNFQDLDNNVSLPFIATVRTPEVKYGTFQGGAANIPVRREFFYYTVPTWDGQRKGADVYKIPQPIPVDIGFNVKLFCNRMRELNEFNKIVMQTFTSKQAYQQIKGHYIPIILDDVSDESAKDLEKRKYYIANYKFTMKGLLIDEEEFQVSPAITRQVTMFEVDTKVKGRNVKIEPPRPNNFDLDLVFVSGNTQLTEVFRYTVDLKINEIENVSNCYNLTYSATANSNLTYTNCTGTVTTTSLVSGDTSTICVKGGSTTLFSNPSGVTYNEGSNCVTGYSVYINGNYVGDNLTTIQINDGDTLLINVVKEDNTKPAIIKTTAFLV
jgi:hypothetical protein